jgi:hypothetical protein
MNKLNSQSEPKSFKLYSGKKAPLLIQILAGFIWLAAAGILFNGVFNLISNPILGAIIMLVGVFAIITGKSLFSMRKSAIKNSMIMATFFITMSLWSLITTKLEGGLGANQSELLLLLYGVLLVLIVLRYKSQFIN